MLRDVQYFKSRISRLDGAARLVDYLVQIVAEKRVQQQPAPPADQSETMSPSAPAAPSPQAGDDAVSEEKA